VSLAGQDEDAGHESDRDRLERPWPKGVAGRMRGGIYRHEPNHGDGDRSRDDEKLNDPSEHQDEIILCRRRLPADDTGLGAFRRRAIVPP
jgi:hypothetical protein